MVRYTQRNFDPQDVIEEHLITPAHVISGGLFGRFDSLRVALEHLQSFEADDETLLVILAPGDELQFADQALDAMIWGFAKWLSRAGSPSPTSAGLN